MKPEEIKIGGVYDVRVKVIKKIPAPARGNLEIGAYTVDRTTQLPMEYEMSWFLAEETPAFVEVTPENDSKNSDPAPKYDPCREFRVGDKVKLKTNFGRNPYDTFDGSEYIPDDTVFTVLRDEWAGGKVDIFEKEESDAFTVHFTNLELVIPVEELEPYEVTESTDYFAVFHRVTGDELATFWKEWHPNPAAAAAAECDRLNAEHRKEQK